MKFVQFIEYSASTEEAAEMQRVADEWSDARGEESPLLARLVLKDRDNADKYVIVVTFPSYEEAMANSNHPATQEFARRLSEIAGHPTFRNFNVQDEFTA